MRWCLQGGFSYSGQRCTAVKVVLVHESVADELVDMVLKGVKGLSVGKPEVRPAGLEFLLHFNTVEFQELRSITPGTVCEPCKSKLCLGAACCRSDLHMH